MAERKRKTVGLLSVINANSKNKVYAFSIFTLAVLLVLLLGAVRPTLITISDINKQIREKEKIDKKLEDKIESITGLGVQYSNIKEDAENLPLLFPTEGNFSLLMSNIEQISAENGFTLSSINFGKGDEFEAVNLSVLQPWSVTMNVTGQKGNLVTLLESYEAMPMYPVVSQVSYNNKVVDGRTAFSIKLTIFHIEETQFFD
jgi:Tfp pilus assembly protein PilO